MLAFIKNHAVMVALDAAALILAILTIFVGHHYILGILLILLAAFASFMSIRWSQYQTKQAEADAQIEAAKQKVNLFIINKKKVAYKDAGLPAQVMDSIPKLMRRHKVCVLKVKAGPQIINLICKDEIFDSVPEKKEVVAYVSGIYVTYVKSLRGNKNTAPVEQKKKSKWAALWEKAQEKAGAKPIK